MGNRYWTSPERSVANEHWMKRAAALARRAEGWTTPNPIVGAVVVHDGLVVGCGYHAKAGSHHAEKKALHQAGQAARNADLYVTLEPCAHEGRTPPCVDAIIDAGIKRVIVGIVDPNPMVNGKGLSLLASAGIDVRCGILENLCKELILPYWIAATKQRPFVHLKLATSADGRIAPPSGKARWITGLPARRLGHRLRRRYDSVLVGVGTVLADDPGLDVRMGKQNQPHPVPVVLDSMARTPLSAKLVARKPGGNPPILICSKVAPSQRVDSLRKAGTKIIQVSPTAQGRIDVKIALQKLWDVGIRSVLVEGGSEIAGSFIRASTVDRITLLLAPFFLGKRGVPSVGEMGVENLNEVLRGKWRFCRRIGQDMLAEIDPEGN